MKRLAHASEHVQLAWRRPPTGNTSLYSICQAHCFDPPGLPGRRRCGLFGIRLMKMSLSVRSAATLSDEAQGVDPLALLRCMKRMCAEYGHWVQVERSPLSADTMVPVSCNRRVPVDVVRVVAADLERLYWIFGTTGESGPHWPGQIPQVFKLDEHALWRFGRSRTLEALARSLQNSPYTLAI